MGGSCKPFPMVQSHTFDLWLPLSDDAEREGFGISVNRLALMEFIVRFTSSFL